MPFLCECLAFFLQMLRYNNAYVDSLYCRSFYDIFWWLIFVDECIFFYLIVSRYIDPQPEYSAVREASFGHGIFDIVNRTHALFYWHRNQDGEAVMADSYWLNNQYWKTSVRIE